MKRKLKIKINKINKKTETNDYYSFNKNIGNLYQPTNEKATNLPIL